MAIRQIEGKQHLAGIDSLGGVIRSPLETRPAGGNCGCGACYCGTDQRVPVTATLDNPTGWAVQPGSAGEESNAPLSPDVMVHLADVAAPVEQSIVEQLIENTSIKISGFPIPNKIEINGHVEF